MVNSEVCSWKNKEILNDVLKYEEKGGLNSLKDNIQILLIKDDDLHTVKLFKDVNFTRGATGWFNGIHSSRDTYIFGFSLIGFPKSLNPDDPKELTGIVTFTNGNTKESVKFNIKSNKMKLYSYFFESPIAVTKSNQLTMGLTECDAEFYELETDDGFHIGTDGTTFFLGTCKLNVFANLFYY